MPIWDSEGLFFFFCTQHHTATHNNALHKLHRGKQPHLEQACPIGDHDAVWELAGYRGEKNARMETRVARAKNEKQSHGGRGGHDEERLTHPAGGCCREKGTWQLRGVHRDARDIALASLECGWGKARPQEGNVVRERQRDRPQSIGGTHFVYSHLRFVFWHSLLWTVVDTRTCYKRRLGCTEANIIMKNIRE